MSGIDGFPSLQTAKTRYTVLSGPARESLWKGNPMKKLVSLLLLVLLLPLSGCAGQAEDVSVIATFYPVYVLAENVLDGVEGVKLSSMTPPSTGCLHDYQLLTSDMKALGKAQALLINGAGMESFLPDVESQFPQLTVIDCSQGVELIEEADGTSNAHIWLAPQNAMQMARNIRDGLSSLLPEKAEQIAANTEAYLCRLAALDAELTEQIAALPSKTIVTFHEAFPYFARAYGLTVAAVVALEPDEPVSPRMLTGVIQAVRDAGNPPLFSEPQYESAALRTVAQETGAAVYELDPLVTGDGEKTAYEDVMRKNLTVLQEALGNDT